MRYHFKDQRASLRIGKQMEENKTIIIFIQMDFRLLVLSTKLCLDQKTVILNYQTKLLSNLDSSIIPHTILVKAREGRGDVLNYFILSLDYRIVKP